VRIARCASDRGGVLAPGDSVLHVGDQRKPNKVVRAVEVVGSNDGANSYDVRLPNNKLLLGVPRSHLRSEEQANPETFAKARGSASRARRRRKASASLATPAGALALALHITDEVLYLGPSGKDFKKPRLVHITGIGDDGASCDIRQANGVEHSSVPRLRLLPRSEADPAVLAAAELTAATARTTLAVAELAATSDAESAAAADPLATPSCASATGLAQEPTVLVPSPDRLAQIAEAAQRAMHDITARAVCAVCCCTVQEADTVSVVVSEEPPPAWHSKLKVTPAMNLHPELRAQYVIGEDGADVHPLWTHMCGSHKLDWTIALPVPASDSLHCAHVCPRVRCFYVPGFCAQRRYIIQVEATGLSTCAAPASRASTQSGPRPRRRTASPTAISGASRRWCQSSSTSPSR